MENEDVNGNIHAARVFSTEIQASKVDSPMKINHRIISNARLYAFLLWFMCFGWDASWTRKAQAANDRIVLRLPYRNSANAGKSVPNSVGVGYSDTGRYVTSDFAGVDSSGNIYLVDYIQSGKLRLRCFDRKGRLRAQWPTIAGKNLDSSSVSPDGYVWLGVSGGKHGKESLPLVAYKLGHKKPVVDWRLQIPAAHRKIIGRAVLAWPNTGRIPTLATGGNRVCIRINGEALGSKDQIARALWLLCSLDGSKIISARVALQAYGPETPSLMLDGKLWAETLDNRPGYPDWSKLWLWDIHQSQRLPLIDRIKNVEPWRSKLTLGKVLPPDVMVDKKGHIYLFLRKMRGAEKALVVLNKHHHLIFSLPWRQNDLLPVRWIKPRADGTGFYHIEFLDKEARIYFHSFDGK